MSTRVTKSPGRPRKHANNAQRQAAYRARRAGRKAAPKRASAGLARLFTEGMHPLLGEEALQW